MPANTIEATPNVSATLQVDISDIRSDEYYDWIVGTARRLKEKLPFNKESADLTVVLGSGLDKVWEGLGLTNIVHITDKELGLPVGKTQGHPYEWVAGIAPNGKKILIKSGRVGAIEPDPMGTDTRMGRLSNVDMATAYLRVLDEIGTDVLITTHAAGGIAQPKKPGDKIPFRDIPQIALVTNHIDEAFDHPLLGPKLDRKRSRFPSPNDQDRDLMTLFEESLMVSHGVSPLERVVYYTSNTSPEFEDVAYIHKVIRNGGEVFGMSLGPEKRVIDDCINIGRFINLAVVTNPAQLAFKGGNGELFDARRNLESFGLKLGVGENELRQRELEEFRRGENIVPSAMDLTLSMVKSDRLKKVFPASHTEVMEMGKRAISMLQSGISSVIYGDPRIVYKAIYP